MSLKSILEPDAYKIRLRFIGGQQRSEHKLKVLEHLQHQKTEQFVKNKERNE